jgi:hypothetical protein
MTTADFQLIVAWLGVPLAAVFFLGCLGGLVSLSFGRDA